MVYIKALKFRGFKSFRRAEASFPKGFVCLAGPNGSGKSNITDGIRFALGESSLKALRAKRVSDLINSSCSFGEVVLYIDGEKQYEVKRAIKVDGKDVKTLYKINGRRSTRTLVLEELRQYGLESGSHNIIAQGQVERIVEMSSKERRQIIDNIAGISEYDAKKEEALSELARVDAKINEANLVLGERQIALSELERQKAEALAFLEAQENFKKAKASLISSEYSKLNRQHSEIVQRYSELSSQASELGHQVSVLSSRLEELNGQKKAIAEKIAASASREATIQDISLLKEKIGSLSATHSAQQKDLQRLQAELKEISAEISQARKTQDEIAASIKKLNESLLGIKSMLSQAESKDSGSENNAKRIAQQIESLSLQIISLKEQKAAAEAAKASAEKILRIKRQEKERISAALGSFSEHKLSGEAELYKKEILALQQKLDSLFESEREINRKLPEVEKQLFAAKDKAANLRASISPAQSGLALKTVEELKPKIKGIFGQVSSLISCDQKFMLALEAAAGQRLSYVVVDNSSTAIKVIEKLKETKAGRCTFIPLDIPVRQQDDAPKMAGFLGRLIDFVKYDRLFEPAMNYVFGDTLLFDNAENAKKGGYGKYRMVTLDGELFEKSGAITGGFLRTSLLSKAALDKAEAEAEELKKQKDDLFAQLYSIREEMSLLRKQKAEAEVKLKGIELELKSAQEKQASKKALSDALAQIDAEIQSAEKEIANASSLVQSLEQKLTQAISQFELLKRQLDEENEKIKKSNLDANVRLQQLHAERSRLEAQLQAKNEELEKTTSSLSLLVSKKETIQAQLSECKKTISDLQAQIDENSKLLKEKEAKLSELSATNSKLMSKLKEIEDQAAEVAQQAGKLKAELDRCSKEMMETEIRRQTIETRLADLKASLEEFSGIQIIDASKQELEELMKKSEAIMNSLSSVNLKAPQQYEQKKAEIDEIKSRVESLDAEKKAVFHMIDEIEAKKRSIFLSTFSSINSNFKKLFSYIFKGEGTLLLENTSNPFESGLFIKVKEGGHEKYLDSMSGGEKSLLALLFIFSIQMYKAAPFYILDEADAALDKENSRKLAELLRQLSSTTQFIVVTHNDTLLSYADVVLGVTRTDEGSKIVGVQLTSSASVAHAKKA
ncbi:MAG: chromosome segregation protein SMC [Candidatus Micrarchaeota archaeon]|nr:chromosome segregation protein SMC [Candidatus Micrarchaeota archaeon]